MLYQDTLAGRARLLGYHLNGLNKDARLYIMARNTESRPLEVRTERIGETAPTRIESLLGQVTLLEYFSSTGGSTLSLAPGQAAAIYASPVLRAGTGVNVMQDISSSGRVEFTFVMLENNLTPSQDVIQRLPYLPMDRNHVRGTFPNAVRRLKVNLTQLPTRINIGDGREDPTMIGVDAITKQTVRLSGNYGILYDLEVNGAANTAVIVAQTEHQLDTDLYYGRKEYSDDLNDDEQFGQTSTQSLTGTGPSQRTNITNDAKFDSANVSQQQSGFTLNFAPNAVLAASSDDVCCGTKPNK